MKRVTFFLVLMLGFSPSAFAYLGGGGGGGNLGLSCSNGQVPEWQSGGFTQCLTASGSGTVTSVGLGVNTNLSSIFTVSGTPVTASGTLTLALATQTKNVLFAGPSSGSAAAPTFRALVGADLPTPTATTLGGVESITSASHQWVSYIDTSGVPHQSQPSVSDVTGAAPAASPTFTTSALFSDGTNVYNLAPGWPNAVSCATSATVNFNSLQTATVEVDLTSSDACTLTVSNVVAGGSYVLKILNASGATVTWPTSFDWGTAGAPTLSTSGKYDDIHLLVQSSTSYIHAYVAQGFSH